MFKPLRHTGAAALCVALLAISCAAPAAGLKNGLKIAFVPKQINNPYEVIADDGASPQSRNSAASAKSWGRRMRGRRRRCSTSTR